MANRRKSCRELPDFITHFVVNSVTSFELDERSSRSCYCVAEHDYCYSTLMEMSS